VFSLSRVGSDDLPVAVLAESHVCDGDNIPRSHRRHGGVMQTRNEEYGVEVDDTRHGYAKRVDEARATSNA